MAGCLMQNGGISRRIVDFAKKLVGWLPGAILAVVRTARSKESVVTLALPTLSKAVPWAQVAMG